jgi:hypothetical protein
LSICHVGFNDLKNKKISKKYFISFCGLIFFWSAVKTKKKMLAGLFGSVAKPTVATGAVVSKHVDEKTYIKDTVIPSIRKLASLEKVYENIARDKDLYQFMKTSEKASEKKDVFVLYVPTLSSMRHVDDCSEMKDRLVFPVASRALLHYFTRSLDCSPLITVYVLKNFDTLAERSKLAETIKNAIAPFPLAIVVLHVPGIDTIIAFSVFSVREKSFFMLGTCKELLDRASVDAESKNAVSAPAKKKLRPSPVGVAGCVTPTLSVSTPVASIVMKLTSPLSNMSSRASTPMALSRLGTLVSPNSPTSTVGSGTAFASPTSLLALEWKEARADLVADACDFFCLPPDDKVSFDTLAVIANHRLLALAKIHRDICDSVCRTSLVSPGAGSPGVNRSDQFGRWIRPLVNSKDFYEPLSRYALVVTSLMLARVNHIHWMSQWLAEMETVLFTSRMVLGDIGTEELHVLLQNAASQLAEETAHCVPLGSDSDNVLSGIDYSSFQPSDVEWTWAHCSGMTWKRPETMLGPRFSLPATQDAALCLTMHHGSPQRPLKTFRVSFSTWSAMSKWFNLMDAEDAGNGTVLVSELHVRAFMTVLAREASLALFGNNYVGEKMMDARDGQMAVWWKRNAACIMHSPATPDTNIAVGIMENEKRAMDAEKNKRMSNKKRYENGGTQRPAVSEMYQTGPTVAERVPDIEDVATFMPPCQIEILRKLETEKHIGYHEITSYVPVLVNLGYSGQKIIEHVWKYFAQEHALPKEKQNRPRTKKDLAMEIDTLVQKVVSSRTLMSKDANGQLAGRGFIGDGCLGHQNRLVKDSPSSSVAGCPFVRCGSDKKRLANALAYQDDPSASDAIVSMSNSIAPSKRCSALLQDRHAVPTSFPVKSPAEYIKKAVFHSAEKNKSANQ